MMNARVMVAPPRPDRARPEGDALLRSSRKMSRALAAATALAVVVAACGGDDDGGAATTAASVSSTPGATEAPSTTDGAGSPTTTAAASDDVCTADRAGGSLTVGVVSEAQGLDPAGAPGAGTTGGTERAAVFDTLLRYNQATGEYEPRIAESVTSNDDGSVWTIKIRDGVTFGNGDPLDAAAVAASIQRHIDPEARSTVRRALNGATLAVLDDLTVELTLAKAWAGFPFVLAREGGMITNPNAVAANPEGFTLDPGAGAGPFEVVTYQPGEPLVMKARANYWGGPVCIENLTFEFVPSNQARFEGLTLDEMQVAYLSAPTVVAEAVASGYPGLDNVVSWGNGLIFNVGLSNGSAPTSDVRVRRAIALAIDADVIDERVYAGTGLPTKALVGPQSRLWTGVEGLPYDPDTARALVEEAKADGWDGKLRVLCNNEPSRIDGAIAVEAMLEAVGMDVDLNTSVTIPGLVTAVNVDHDFDAACWGPSADDGGMWLTFSNFESTSPQNVNGLNDPGMDAALAALAAASGDDELKAAVAQLSEAWNDQVPGVVFASQNYRVTHAEKVRGITSTSSQIVLFDDAYLES